MSGVRNSVLLESDIFSTGFVGDQFDAVFCWDVLGHLEAVDFALQEIVRVCRPGGYLVGSIFALSDPARGQGMKPIADEQYVYAGSYYYRFYSEGEVRELLKPLAVQVVTVDLQVWSEPPHPGFREFEHEHHSWAFTARKLG